MPRKHLKPKISAAAFQAEQTFFAFYLDLSPSSSPKVRTPKSRPVFLGRVSNGSLGSGLDVSQVRAARGLAQQEGGEGDGAATFPSQIKSAGKRSAHADVDFRDNKTLLSHDGAGEARRPDDSTDSRTEGAL